MQCLTISSIRRIIGLRWNIKGKNILPDSTSQESDSLHKVPEETIRNAVCRLKGLEGPFFHLELTNQLNVLVKGQCSRWSFKLKYAFAVVKDRAFLVKYCDKLNFLDILKPDHLDLAEEVTFHCMVLVGPPVAHSTSAEPAHVNINEGLSSEGQFCDYLEDVVHPECEFDGGIPKLTVDKAKKLITKESTSSVLKVLAMEYLMKSIKAENVSDILKIAIDQDLKILQKQSSKFLSRCTIRSSSSSPDLSSSEESFHYENLGYNVGFKLNQLATFS